MAAPAMNPDSERQKHVFVEALGVAIADRPARIARLCEGDAELSSRCAGLLQAHDEAERIRFLEPSSDGTEPTSAAPPDVVATPPQGLMVSLPDHDLIAPLARGGFGEVWMARNRHTDRYCAVKIVDRNAGAELEGVRKLQHCVARHAHLMPIDHVGVSDGFLFIIMPLADNASDATQVMTPAEYVPMSLEHWVRRHGPLDTPNAIELGKAIASALHAMHASGLVHGDVKPQNILRLDDQWVLADYSLVGRTDAESPRGRTRGYTPRDGAGTPSGDLFALGQTLIFVGTGQHPSDTERAQGVLHSRGMDSLCADLTSEHATMRGTASEALARLEGIRPANRRGARRVAMLLVMVLLAGILLLNVIKQPLASVPTTFNAHIYRGDPAVELGRAASLAGPALLGDAVRIEIEFAAPMYAYLFVFSPDGSVQLCHPDAVTQPPRRVSSISYPTQSPGAESNVLDLHALEEGTGTYVFVLIASDKKLRSFDAWHSAWSQSGPSTESLSTNALLSNDFEAPMHLRYSKGQQVEAESSRGITQRARANHGVHELLAKLSATEDIVWVEGLVIPVVEAR